MSSEEVPNKNFKDISGIELSIEDLKKISWWNMSPKVSEFVNETKWGIDTIKNRKNVLFSDLENLESFSDFDWYVEHRQELLKKLNKFFEPELEGESDEYKFYFNNWMWSSLDIDKYSKSELDNFNRLLIKKALLQKELTLEVLKNWNYNEFLTKEEIEDFILILDLKITETSDRLYIWFKENNVKYRKKYYDWNELKFTGETTYAWVWEEGFVPYNSFLSKSFLEKIKNIDFDNLNNKFLKEYFTKYRELLVSWDMNYDNWLELWDMEMQTWANKDSRIWIIWTMESYWLQKVTYDPEFEIFFKNPSDKLEKLSSDLSEKYFGESYKMFDTKYSNVEPFISSGVTSLKMILWKNFHNDLSLQEKFWVYLYLINSRMDKNEQKIISFWKVFDKGNSVSKDELTKYKTDFVWQHEFWHNLFKGNWYKSNLEENKANLFSLLFKYDSYLERDLDQKDLETIINNLLISELRRFIDKEKKFNEYIFSTKVQFNKMFDLWLIYWNESWKIAINYDKELLKKTLEEMKEFLFLTKEIYESKDKDREMQIITEIEDNFQKNYEKILELLSK